MSPQWWWRRSCPVLLVTLLIGARGVAAMRTTSDFLVASRRISPTVNAAAVSGEYLSAASFLGVAGLVVKDGRRRALVPGRLRRRLRRDAQRWSPPRCGAPVR